VEFKFKHKILTFNPVGILTTLGITPITYPIRYYILVAEALKIIETQVRLTALKLNFMLKEAYQKDMYDIAEYRRFPRYIEVMQRALSNPKHVGLYWDNKNVVQAKFVDTDLLGSLKDLQQVQKMVHPGGTLEGWIGIYNAWLSGRSNLYAEIVNQRLDIMEAYNIAPFWELIERENIGGYPTNIGQHTLQSFAVIYNREMVDAYLKCLSMLRLLMLAPTTFRAFEAATVVHQDKRYFGYKWITPTGRTMFVTGGTERLVAGRLAGRGFILSLFGNVVKRWSGWLPR
jgi:hypothetical protein